MSISTNRNNNGGYSKVTSPKTNAGVKKSKILENSSIVISPPSSAKNSEFRAHFFKVLGAPKTKAKGISTSDIVSAVTAGYNTNISERKIMNNSGQIKFEKPNHEWLKFSDLSHNSSFTKLGVKENNAKRLAENAKISEK